MANAIEADLNNMSLYYDIVDSYYLSVVNNGVSRKAFTIDIICPIKQSDLIRYGVKSNGKPYSWQIAAIGIGAALLICISGTIFALRKRRNVI